MEGQGPHIAVNNVVSEKAIADMLGNLGDRLGRVEMALFGDPSRHDTLGIGAIASLQASISASEARLVLAIAALRTDLTSQVQQAAKTEAVKQDRWATFKLFTAVSLVALGASTVVSWLVIHVH